MAGMTDLAIRIATTLDSTGLNKADKSVKSFEKTIKGLGRTLGVTLSATAIVAFGKKAAQAFIQDQKEATRLASAVKNLGLELSQPAINQYIDSLSKASGVTDSQLRPAFQALLTTTGSLTASQKALQQAIDVSVGSGVELTTVSQDLANAYIGQTRGLRKYNLGLSQAQLKTASFEEVTARLNKQFGGANAAFLDTYAGKLQTLGTAAGEAQEKIGAALIDLAMAFSGSGGMDDFIVKIETLTDRVIGMFDKFTEGIAILKAISAGGLSGMLGRIQDAQVAEFNRRMKRDYMKAFEGTNLPMSPQALAQQKAAEAAARKRAQDLAKVTVKNTAELKKQNALKKAGTVFDLEQIQLIAALKGKLSDEDKKRLEAQLAILNGNEMLATKLTRDILMAQDSSGKLYQYFLSIGDAKIKNPFAFLDEWLIQFQSKLNELKFPSMPTAVSAAVAPTSGVVVGFTPTPMNPIPTTGAIQGPQIPSTNVGTLPTGNFTYGQGNPLNTNVYVTVQGSVTTEEDLVTKIASGLQQKSLSTGDSSYINRRTGGFAG
jgi:hypothetical protein